MGGFLTPVLNLLMLSGGDPVVDYPDPADVRLGVVYKGGTLTGTLVGGGVTPDDIADIAAAVVARQEFINLLAIAYDPTAAAAGGRVQLSNGKWVSIQVNGMRLIEDS